MTLAKDLACFVTTTRYEEIPPKALEYAAMLVSSTLASAAMGSTLPSAKIMLSLLLQRGGAQESSVWFCRGQRLPVASAARINALMSDAAASDDSDLRNITHPGTTLVASALAAAQQTKANGRQVLTAIALGYEVAGRINTGVIPGLIWEKGFHGCMVAIFGGAVATGLLLKLDAERMANAIGLAATSIAGLLASASTSMAREHHAGLAASLGVEAAQLASLGYTVEQSVLEHPRGFFFAYGAGTPSQQRIAQITQGLGEDWMILTDMAIKLVPGGHPYHAIGEAAANAARLGDIVAADITAIRIARPDTHQIKGPRHPIDLIGMAHSPYYFAAAGAADRTFGWTHASAAKIMDPSIRRLLDLVEIDEKPPQDSHLYRQGATVTIETKDGRKTVDTVYAPRGSAANGIAWSDVKAKFAALCPFANVSETEIERLHGLIHGLADLASVEELVHIEQFASP